LRHTNFILILYLLVFAIPAMASYSSDIDDSNVVDFVDFAILADDWQTSPSADPNGDIDESGFVDYNDLAILAEQWLDGITGTKPETNDINTTAYTFITYPIDLSDYTTDDGIPPLVPLNYIIVSTPNDANCYIQDPASGCGKITEAMCPYTLRNNGAVVWLAADNTETFVFTWKANDTIYDSNDANCTVVVSENPHDHLSFNGEPNSIVEIPDNSYFDISDSGWACSFWYNNLRRSPNEDLIKKRASGPGWDITTKSGRLQIDLYDANGLVVSHKGETRISDGSWWEVLITYSDDPCDANDKYIMVYYYQVESITYAWDYTEAFTPSTYLNDVNVVINTISEIDHLRFWDDASEEDPDRTKVILFPLEIRDIYTESIFGIGNASNVRFKMDEGSGSTITDDKLSLVGTIQDTDDVAWTPWNWDWFDINVQQKRRFKK